MKYVFVLLAISFPSVANSQVSLAGLLPPHIEAIATGISDTGIVAGWLVDLEGQQKGWSLNLLNNQVFLLETPRPGQQSVAWGVSGMVGSDLLLVGSIGQGPTRPALWGAEGELKFSLPQKGFFTDVRNGLMGQTYAALTVGDGSLYRLEVRDGRFFPLDGDDRLKPVQTSRISSGGDISGQLLDRHSGNLVAGFWRKDRATTAFVPLNALYPGGRGEALAVNRRRTVVGWSEDANGDWVATVWTRKSNWTPFRIGLPRPGADSQANDIDNAGTVVGAVGIEAFIWRLGELDLSSLPSPPNAEYAEARAISSFGRIVGFASINRRLTPIIW